MEGFQNRINCVNAAEKNYQKISLWRTKLHFIIRAVSVSLFGLSEMITVQPEALQSFD